MGFRARLPAEENFPFIICSIAFVLILHADPSARDVEVSPLRVPGAPCTGDPMARALLPRKG